MSARFAAYYTPAIADPLFRAGAAWLGRDPETNATLARPVLPDIAAITADAARYGFHATLKPPMRLAEGASWDELAAAARAMARTIAPFALPALQVVDHHGFLALRETARCAELEALADRCVEALDAFRAPPSEAELARRRRGGLTPDQENMLRRWGYPYVLATWFFHITLTRRLTEQERAIFLPAAEAHFAAALALPRRVTDIGLFSQSAPHSPFTLAVRIPLLG